MPLRGSLTVGRISALRWAALAVAVVGIATLAVLWYAGRNAKPGEPPRTQESTAGVSSVGKGFDHTVSHDGKPLLRIRGKRDRKDKEGNLHVEEVQITVFQEDGSRYEIGADTASYNFEQRSAQLEGRVNLVGPSGFGLRTEKLTLKEGGRWLESESTVQFDYGTDPPLHGGANELHAQVNRGEFILSGAVHAHARKEDEPGRFWLGADQIFFQRQLHQIRAEGDVLLKWGESHVGCERLAVHLSPEGNRLQFVRARWGVKGEYYDVDEAGRKRYLLTDGDDLSVLLDDAGKQPTEVEMHGDGAASAHLARGSDGGEVFELAAPAIRAQLAQGRLSEAHGDGGVTVAERGPQIPARHLASRTANATFAGDGKLAQLELQGEVKVAEAGRGDIAAARALVTPESTEAVGEPAVLTSPRGELRAPRIVYTKESGLAHAVGGVEATMQPGEDNPMHKTPLADSKEPVRVQSEEGFYRDQPRSFLFKGKVRAWSGDRVLTAEQLRGEAPTPEDQQLSASGTVETVWFVAPREGEKAAPPHQVRVNANTLSYADKAHQLIYEGDVKVVDGQRTLKAKTVTVDLDEKGQAKRMVAVGGVSLTAPAEGRSITAERGDYDVAAQNIVFTGKPVTLVDKKGGNLSGQQAVYTMGTGTVKVTAEAGSGQ